MRKIVLASIGSLGDLHPFIAIGLALKKRGLRAVLAVPEDHLAKVRAAGLEAQPVLPSFATVTAKLGMSEEEVVHRVMRDQRFLLERFLLKWVRPSTLALDEIAVDASAIVGSLFMFAAPIVAQKRGIPLIAAMLQPMTMFSAYEPPCTSDFRFFRHAPVGMAGAAWNRVCYGLAGTMLRARYASQIDEVRVEHGLRPRRAPVLLDQGGEPALTLCCWSSLLGPLQRDAPPGARVVGFPVFDSDGGDVQPLDPEIDRFLSAGKPPLVFTLGSLAIAAPGSFFGEAMEAVRRMGERAVLLAGDAPVSGQFPDVLVRRYLPHSLLFPHASAIIHHGGIGTTAQALIAGKPQLVVPHMGDQYDNAARLVRLGVARILSTDAFSADAAVSCLARLTKDQTYAATASRAATALAGDDGAATAAEAIKEAIAIP